MMLSKMGYPLAYRLIIDSTGVAVLFLNLGILPTVLYFNKWILPSFKLIMMTFAMTNVTHYILDVFCLPRCLQLPGLTIAFTDGFTQSGNPLLGQISMCLLLCLFCIQIFNESAHFLYRYILLCRPSHHYFLETSKVAMFLLVTVPLLGSYQFLVTFSHSSQNPEVTPVIDEAVQKGWNLSAYQLNGVIFQYWDTLHGEVKFHWQGWLAIALFFVPCLSCFGTMLYCGYKTRQTMEVVKHSMSSVTKKQNSVVFRMLVIQSIVPLILLQLPATIVFCGSMFFVLDKIWTDFLVMIILTCPCLEPLIAIYFLSKGKFIKIFFPCLKRNRTYNGVESTLATSDATRRQSTHITGFQ